MSVNREDIFTALETTISNAIGPSPGDGTLKTISRIWKIFADVDKLEQPAMFLQETPELFVNEKNTPRIQTLSVDLIIYTSRGYDDSVVPTTELNNVLDKVQDALKPSPVTFVQDLGRPEVSDVRINGSIEKYPGTEGGGNQAIAVVPIDIILKADRIDSQQQLFFDVGELYAIFTRKVDLSVADLAPVEPQPVRFGSLKGVTLNIDNELIYPSSTKRHHINVANGMRTVKGTARMAVIDSQVWHQFVFGIEGHRTQGPGDTPPNDGSEHVNKETATLAPGPGLTFTVTPPNAGTFVQDLGVFDSDTGLQLVKLASPSAAGFYSVAAGVYTFNAADGAAGRKIEIRYLYSTLTGYNLNVVNEQKGLAPTFVVILEGSYNGRKQTIIMKRCASSAISLPLTLENFAIQDFEFEALADNTETVLSVNYEGV